MAVFFQHKTYADIGEAAGSITCGQFVEISGAIAEPSWVESALAYGGMMQLRATVYWREDNVVGVDVADHITAKELIEALHEKEFGGNYLQVRWHDQVCAHAAYLIHC
jgi:hypothetical protein